MQLSIWLSGNVLGHGDFFVMKRKQTKQPAHDRVLYHMDNMVLYNKNVENNQLGLVINFLFQVSNLAIEEFQISTTQFLVQLG